MLKRRAMTLCVAFAFLLLISTTFADVDETGPLEEQIPIITSVSPIAFSNDGPVVVTIEGANFQSPLAVIVGEVAVTDPTIVSLEEDGVIYYRVPAGSPAGSYDFRVLTPFGESNSHSVLIQEGTRPEESFIVQEPIIGEPTNPDKTISPTLPPQPIDPNPKCTIASVVWEQDSALIGEQVSFRATALDESCDGQSVEFDIVEEDLTGRSRVGTTAIAYFTGKEGRGTLFLSEELFTQHITSFWEFGTGEFRLVTTDTDLSLITGYAISVGSAYSKILQVNLPETIEEGLGDTQGGQESYADNSITITEREGKTTINYPIQIGRIFKKGDIQEFPQAMIGESKIVTQADVKTRWDDGSVQHAIMTFYIPKLDANAQVNIHFQNQKTGNNAQFLTAKDMLANSNQDYNFNARILLSDSNSNTASAQAITMLLQNNFEYWLQGSEATSIILADHSTKRSYDIGFDTHKSLRPIFHATFFPRTKQVRIRYIGEISHTEALQNMGYNLELQIGTANTQVYKQDNVKHLLGARWTKEYWLNGAPSKIDINHNLRYLSSTGFISNYDTSLTVPQGTIDSQNKAWNNADKRLFSKGIFGAKRMGDAGGRADIGPWPAWVVRWLYTGDNGLQAAATGSSELAGAWPMNFREGNATKEYAAGVPAIGKEISTWARPTARLFDGNGFLQGAGVKGDKMNVVGTLNYDGWLPDCSHQPDPFSAPYVLTGDYWHLEQLQFWASWASFLSAEQSVSWGRGPTGREGGLKDQSRGMAWCLRNRARAAFLSPDGSDQKLRYETLLHEMISSWEGAFNLQTSRKDNSMWKWGNTVVKSGKGSAAGPDRGWWGDWGAKAYEPPKLGYWLHGNLKEPRFTKDSNTRLASPWMQNQMLYSLGHAGELGYPTQDLLAHHSKFLIGQLTDKDYDPFLVSQYRIPVRKPNGDYYGSFADVKAAYKDNIVSGARTDLKNRLGDVDYGYPFLALAAGAYITDQPEGTKAYKFLEREIYNESGVKERLATNPKWAILPREHGTNDFGTSKPFAAIGKGCTNAFWIDEDCDGYGVASPRGPDANDKDPTLNTPQSATAKYGSFTAANGIANFKRYLYDLGYVNQTGNVYVVSPTGSTNPRPNDFNNPYKEAIPTPIYRPAYIRPGDTIVYLEGRYPRGIRTQAAHLWKAGVGNYYPGFVGNKTHPVLVINAPGEVPRMNHYYSSGAINNGTIYTIIDGLVFDAEYAPLRYATRGFDFGAVAFDHIILRNSEFTKARWNIMAAIRGKRNDITLDHIVAHNAVGEHCFYKNDDYVDGPDYRWTISDSLFYRCKRHGIHWRGGDSLIVNGSKIHSNAMMGVEVKNGLVNGLFINNLIFNNGRAPITIWETSESNTNPPNKNIHFYHNLLTTTSSRTNGMGLTCLVVNNAGCKTDNPSSYVTLNIKNKNPPRIFPDLVFKNNIILPYTQEIFSYSLWGDVMETTLENNVLYEVFYDRNRELSGMHTCGSGQTDNTHDVQTKGSYCEPKYVWSFGSMHNATARPKMKNDKFADPKLSNAYGDYGYTPHLYGFDYAADSPAVDFGLANVAPPTDIRGNPRDANPDVGPYELPDRRQRNQHPVADAGGDRTITDNDGDFIEEIQLDATKSFDPDGSITHYSWYSKGNLVSNNPQLTVTLGLGDHKFSLVVFDNRGLASEAVVTITIAPGSKTTFLKQGYAGYSKSFTKSITEAYDDPRRNTRQNKNGFMIGRGYAGGKHSKARTIVYFSDLKTLLDRVPNGEDITAAKLRVYRRDYPGSTHEISGYAIKRPIDINRVTWDEASGTQRWQIPGAYGDQDVDKSPVFSFMSTPGEKLKAYDIDILPYLNDVRFNRRANNGLLVRADNESLRTELGGATYTYNYGPYTWIPFDAFERVELMFSYGVTSCNNGQKMLCVEQRGVCKGAQKTCTNNRWPACGVNEYNYTGKYEQLETNCNDGLDNDCDGRVDQGRGCPAFNFNIAANPSSGSAVQGGYNETTVTITKTTTGSSGTVTLKALNNPSNITTTFYPSSCNFDNKKTSCTSRLRIDVGPQAKTGINTIAIEGTSGTTKKQTTYNLDVKKKILPGTPIITSIEPNRISNRIDTDISIKGENFTELAGLLIGTILLPIDKTIPINKTLIRYLATKGLTTGTYPIKVINLDLKESNSVNLIIEDTAATQKTLDTDLDGIPNLRDKCPRTPSKLHQRTKQGKSGCPLPNYGKFNKTITTNFTNITNPHQIPNFKIGIINKGQITFKENISITKVNLNYLRFEQINLEENIDIKKTSVRLDEQNIPTLNVKSEIELYNTSITNPVPTRNKKVCNDCKITNYNTKTTNTKIEVQGWSEYEITQGRCGDKYCSITETKNNCPNDCGKTGGSGGGGGGGSGGGGGGGSPSNTIKINLDDNKTHTKTIKEGTKIDLTLNGKIHQLEITKTENNTVTIHFKNISKILTTKTLELYSIDITLDNKKDIELYTTKTKNTHEITIKKIQQKNINEKDKKQNNTKNKKPTTKETPKTFKPTQTGLWILIIGIITIITTIITTKKKKR